MCIPLDSNIEKDYKKEEFYSINLTKEYYDNDVVMYELNFYSLDTAKDFYNNILLKYPKLKIDKSYMDNECVLSHKDNINNYRLTLNKKILYKKIGE